MKLALSLLLFAAAAVADDSFPRSPVCWPLNFAGITLAVTTESQLERLLGKGSIRNDDEEVHHQYLDRKGLILLDAVVSFGAVHSLTIQSLKTGQAKAPPNVARSQWLDPNESIGNWHALRLGSTLKEVSENLGTPQETISTAEWRYDTKCTCELPEYFTVHFTDGRLDKIVFTSETD